MKIMDKKSRNVIVRLMISAAVLIILVLSIQSLGWFTHNFRNNASSFDLAAAYVPFELGTVGNVVPYQFQTTDLDYTKAPKGIIKEIKDENGDSLNLSVTEDDTEIKWLINADSTFENYDASSDGLHPGSHGVISFYIIPKRDGELNVNFNLSMALYDSAESKIDGENVIKFANGHILFFRKYNGDSRIYSDRIINTFTFNRDNLKSGTAYKADIYWIWPDVVDELILPKDDPYFTGSNNKIISEKNDIDNFYSHMSGNFDYYFSGDENELQDIPAMLSNVGLGSSNENFNEEFYKILNKQWNNADQIIGTSAAYIELKLSAS